MKLTDGEKLIVLMLSEVYEKLEINGEIDPDFIRSAIFNDKLWGINWKYSGIPFENSEDPKIVKEVIDILDMWSFIESSYQELSDEDKSLLEKNAAPFGKDPKFIGFDGNNETDYMGTALFIVNDLERFEKFKGRSLNSHSPSVDSHQRMLSVFEPMRHRLTPRLLSVNDLTLILKERIHPSHRKDD